MTTSSTPVDFNSAALPAGSEEIARLIVKSFADAGFGGPQQIAALANAIAESNLNPKAIAAGEKSVGLFQVSSTHGLGAGHTAAQLKDPATSLSIVMAEARKFPHFGKATSLEEAVSSFVRFVMRPADPAGETARRLKIAERLAQKG